MSDESKIGYGRPPVHSRFAPGTSGNPKGRPKGSFRADLIEELSELIPDPGGGGRVCTKRRAIVKKLIADSLKGEAKDAVALVLLCAKLLPEQEETDPRAAEEETYVAKLAERERQGADHHSTPPNAKEANDD